MISVESFDTRCVPDATQLFTDSYASFRKENPLLPPQFTCPESIEPMLAKMAREHPGAIAFDGGRVAGYLVGYSAIPEFFGYSQGAYVPVYGHCITPADEAKMVFTALYAHMSALWVERGSHSHAISFFVDCKARAVALESLLFGLGFGLQVIDGIRPMSPVEAPASDDITIRSANAEVLAAIHDLDGKLGSHLRGAPIFLHTRPVPAPDLHDNFLRDGVKTIIAWRNGAPIAAIRGVLNAGPGCELFSVEGSLGVNFAFTEKSARRTGVATRLLDMLLQWGAHEGMTRCVVDFESANLPARGFWLRHFQPVCHSVLRRVDDRI